MNIIQHFHHLDRLLRIHRTELGEIWYPTKQHGQMIILSGDHGTIVSQFPGHTSWQSRIHQIIHFFSAPIPNDETFAANSLSSVPCSAMSGSLPQTSPKSAANPLKHRAEQNHPTTVLLRSNRTENWRRVSIRRWSILDPPDKTFDPWASS